MLRSLTRFLLLLLVVHGMAGAWAGELKGDEFISTKFGRFEIQSPGGKWRIEDKEEKGSAAIAYMFLKGPPEDFFTGILIHAESKRFLLSAERVISDYRAVVTKAGGECGPEESRTYAARQVTTFVCRSKGCIREFCFPVLSRSFLLEGRSAYFLVNGTAGEKFFERRESLFDEVVENLKY